jgi:hypothetical protein
MMASSSANPSETNPFRVASAFNLPLKAETCQQFHADALRRATRNPQAYATPSGVPITELRAHARRYGPQAYLAHPAEIERLFRGVTLSVYQEIESLYCSRIGRSCATVYRILRAKALEAGVAPVEEEAVWAICMHLEELRAQRTAVTVERAASTWWLTQLALASSSDSSGASAHDGTQHLGTLVIDTDAPRALAFRAGERRAEAQLRSLAIYDAIALERRPAPLGAGGLVWRVPSCLVVERELPLDCQRGCSSLGIPVERATRSLPLVEELRACWAGEQARRAITPGRCALVFESVLNRVFGTSPQRAREEREHALGRLIGYAQDPAELFPALRAFLPAQAAMIGQDGEVAFDGLHYVERLLSYWPGSPATVRRSEQTEAALWVYLEAEILCQAKARELARRDGSYRAARGGR